MSDNSDGAGKKPGNQAEGAYSVGFGRPPKHSQFKPGQSGNPKGPPKKKPSSKQLFDEALGREVAVTINGQKQMMSLHEALVASSVDKAMKGTLKEKLALLKLIGDLDADSPPDSKSIVDEHGRLTVRVNIGKPPGLLDPDAPK